MYVHLDRVSELAVVKDVLKKYIDPEQADAIHRQRYHDGKLLLLLLSLLCSKTICMHSVIKQHRALSVTCVHKRNLREITK